MNKKPNKAALVVLSTVLGVLVLCVVVGLVGAAFGIGKGSSSTKAAATGTASTATRAVESSAVGLAESAAGIPPKPDNATSAAYIKDLNAIDPDIVGKHSVDVMVDRGRNQCSSIKTWPNDHAKLLTLTKARFTSTAHPDGFETATVERILQVVHNRLCPSYPMA